MRDFTRRGWIGAGLAAACSPAMSQAAPEPGALAADVALLQDIYQSLHPGLYRYQTPADFSRRCADLKASLSAAATLEAQYLGLSRLLATVWCGHTYANFFNQSKAVSDRLIAPANKLPFHFVWLDGRMVVSGNPRGAGELAPGDEVVAINGVASGAILARLLPLVRGDGANDDKRRALLEVTGADRIETFDVYYPLLFPDATGRFDLAVRRIADGRDRTCRVAAIDQSQREAMAPLAPGSKGRRPGGWTGPRRGRRS